MNLKLVAEASSGPLVFRCCACRRTVNQAHENVYADLDGQPFGDYYCPLCAGEERRLRRGWTPAVQS